MDRRVERLGPANTIEAVAFLGTPASWGELPELTARFTETFVIDLTDERAVSSAVDFALELTGGRFAHLVVHDLSDAIEMRTRRHRDKVASVIVVGREWDSTEVVQLLQSRIVID